MSSLSEPHAPLSRYSPSHVTLDVILIALPCLNPAHQCQKIIVSPKNAFYDAGSICRQRGTILYQRRVWSAGESSIFSVKTRENENT
jgi:hypothetical protein